MYDLQQYSQTSSFQPSHTVLPKDILDKEVVHRTHTSKGEDKRDNSCKLKRVLAKSNLQTPSLNQAPKTVPHLQHVQLWWCVPQPQISLDVGVVELTDKGVSPCLQGHVATVAEREQ
jgi:hypothetical protein